MSQAIKLPINIVSGVPKITNIGIHTMLVRYCEEINNYAREVALVAVILTENHFNTLYESIYGNNNGYIACIDEIHKWAVEYVHTFAHVTDWEEFIMNDKTIEGCTGWDDHVAAFGALKLRNISKS